MKQKVINEVTIPIHARKTCTYSHRCIGCCMSRSTRTGVEYAVFFENNVISNNYINLSFRLTVISVLCFNILLYFE